MPYALFCNDAKLSKAYPTEADVWKGPQNRLRRRRYQRCLHRCQ